MRREVNSKDIKHLYNEETLTDKLIIDLIQHDNSMHPKEIAAANSLLQDAGDYLFRHISLFIKDDIDENEAKVEIDKQRSIVSRIRLLLPTILSFYQYETERQPLYILRRIHDLASDYEAIVNSGKYEANRKKTREKIVGIDAALRHLNEQLRANDGFFGYEFEDYHHSINNRPNSSSNRSIKFHEFMDDLLLFQDYMEVYLYRFDKDEQLTYIPSNKAKTKIVELVYELGLQHKGPSYSTTPGSDFSIVCGLVYEIATGLKDESLAGAINRFSKSSEKREIDAGFLEHEKSMQDYVDGDNFLAVKNARSKLRSEIRSLADEIEDARLSRQAKVLLMCHAEEKIRQFEKNEKQFGPHIVWADQMNRDWDSELAELERSKEKTIELNLELGNRRRKIRSKKH